MSKESEERIALRFIEISLDEHGWYGKTWVETLDNAINELEELRKRNHPAKLLKEEGEERFEYDEWYMPVGRCPLCNKRNPVYAKYCIECGQALEKIEDGEYHHE